MADDEFEGEISASESEESECEGESAGDQHEVTSSRPVPSVQQPETPNSLKKAKPKKKKKK